jgi:hypothetical protein
MAGIPYATIPITGSVDPLGGATVPENVTSPTDAAITWAMAVETRLGILDRVGDPAANRMHIEADRRTRTVLALVRWLTANSNAVDTCYLRRDGTAQEGSPTTGMTGDLVMNSHKVTGLANGTAAGDAANKGQLDLKVNKAGDTMSGTLEFTAGGVLLANNVAVSGKNPGGTARTLIWCGSSGEVHVGDTNTSLTVDANGVTVLASAGGLITALAQLNTDVYMSNNRFLYGKETGGTTRSILGLNNGNTLHLGDGNIPTWINGAGIRFNTDAYLGWGFSLYMVGDDSVNYPAVGFDSAQNLWIGSSASGLVLAAPAIGGGRGALIKAYSTEYPAGSMLWHEHNDGPSSGMNADRLDNYEAVDFFNQVRSWAYGATNNNFTIPVDGILALTCAAAGGGGSGSHSVSQVGSGGAGGGITLNLKVYASETVYWKGASAVGGPGGVSSNSGTDGGSAEIEIRNASGQTRFYLKLTGGTGGLRSATEGFAGSVKARVVRTGLTSYVDFLTGSASAGTLSSGDAGAQGGHSIFSCGGAGATNVDPGAAGTKGAGGGSGAEHTYENGYAGGDGRFEATLLIPGTTVGVS